MDNIDKKVLLLGIYKKADDESAMDVVLKMENTRVFSLKVGKKYLKELRDEGYLLNGNLTFVGEATAKSIEAEFKLH